MRKRGPAGAAAGVRSGGSEAEGKRCAGKPRTIAALRCLRFYREVSGGPTASLFSLFSPSRGAGPARGEGGGPEVGRRRAGRYREAPGGRAGPGPPSLDEWLGAQAPRQDGAAAAAFVSAARSRTRDCRAGPGALGA